jgi:hypothetical protein
MHSLISEDYESHEQQADRSDANFECQVGPRRDALRFPPIHQNSSYAARMRKRPVSPRLAHSPTSPRFSDSPPSPKLP